MGINSSAAMLGSSVPAPQTDVGHASPSNNGTDPGAPEGSGGAGVADASTGPFAGQKTAGPSSQTRGNARSARARNNAAGPTDPVSADQQGTVSQPVSNFGSVMATALGRAAAGKDSATPVSVPPAGTADSTDSSGSTGSESAKTSGQQSQGAADAVTWIAQALMPPPAGGIAPPGSATDACAANSTNMAGLTDAGASADSSSAAPDAQTVAGLAAQLAAQNAKPAGQTVHTATNGAGTAAATDSLDPSVAPSTDAQTTAMAAAVAGPINLSALAGAQKIVSGLAHADAVDADTDNGTPTTHATAPSSSTDDTQTAAALQAASLTHSNGALGAATLTIHAPVGSAAFADEVSARVTGLAQSGITQAQLQLNPADLGPVQVHITMQAGQASVWFGATHADTRAALEQSLPRLRELFSGAGLPLADAGVFREPPQQQQAPSLPTASGLRKPLDEPQPAATVTQVALARLSLLDTYA